ncbi:MAG: SUF system NifU family Fe-S cluster assembly protein [Candidatus Kerfeldbacteria bacterium]|nr:SUF system NifU family Fe-S cluster assembly protein [Candidatus Kerfeldbacteria bacterium]
MPDELYKEIILDHHKNPRHFGTLKKPTHEAHLENTLCGDEVTMQLKVEGLKIKDVAFSGSGCAITTAAASLLTDAVLGKSLAAVKKLGTKDIDKLLGVKVGPAREKCAYLGLETLQRALEKAKA